MTQLRGRFWVCWFTLNPNVFPLTDLHSYLCNLWIVYLIVTVNLYRDLPFAVVGRFTLMK
jgi:hypothetical protein